MISSGNELRHGAANKVPPINPATVGRKQINQSAATEKVMIAPTTLYVARYQRESGEDYAGMTHLKNCELKVVPSEKVNSVIDPRGTASSSESVVVLRIRIGA